MLCANIGLRYNAHRRFPVSPQVIFGFVFHPSLQIFCKHVILETAVFVPFCHTVGLLWFRAHVFNLRPHEGVSSLTSKELKHQFNAGLHLFPSFIEPCC